MLDELRQHLARLQKPAGLVDGPATLPFGVPAVDEVLGGGLARGALHEIAALSEAHLPAATGFTLGLAALLPSPRKRGEGGARSAPGEGQIESTGNAPSPARRRFASAGDLSPHSSLNGERSLAYAGRGEGRRSVVWVAEDMALAESGAPHGAGLDAFGLSPQRLLTVAVAHRQDLMWTMEEALRCRAVGAVIGEVRHGALDSVAVRRLSLAAGDSGALAFLLRAQPAHDASTAVTRWMVGTASSFLSSLSPGWGGSAPKAPGWGDISTEFTPTRRASHGDLPPPGGGERKTQRLEPGAPRFAAHLTRNRRGPTASWILEWRPTDERFVLAAHAEPVAAPLRHRSHQKVA